MYASIILLTIQILVIYTNIYIYGICHVICRRHDLCMSHIGDMAHVCRYKSHTSSMSYIGDMTHVCIVSKYTRGCI